MVDFFFFFFQAEDGIRDVAVTGVQTCALPICAVPLHERLFLPEDGIRGDDRRRARADDRCGGSHSTPRHRRGRSAMRRLIGRVALYAGLTLAAVTFVYPFLWMAATTFKPPYEVGTLTLVPEQITLDNYRTMWARAPFGRALLNSVLVATTITSAVL